MIWSETSKGNEWKAKDPAASVWTVRKTGLTRYEGSDPMGHVVCTQPTLKLCQRDTEKVALRAQVVGA